jgi:hypothetical protein
VLPLFRFGVIFPHQAYDGEDYNYLALAGSTPEVAAAVILYRRKVKSRFYLLGCSPFAVLLVVLLFSMVLAACVNNVVNMVGDDPDVWTTLSLICTL